MKCGNCGGWMKQYGYVPRFADWKRMSCPDCKRLVKAYDSGVVELRREGRKTL